MLNVFISGLEKQSGKTLVTAGLAATMQSLSYSTGVYKPIQTGATLLNGIKSSPDLAFIKRIDSNIEVQSSYVLQGKESPFVSSYEDGLKIDLNTIFTEYRAFSKTIDCNIVEGSNSISTPIMQYLTELDIVKTLKIPLILVVNPKITPIDNMISALKYIKSENVDFMGVILNQHNDQSDNLEQKYYPQIIKEISEYNILGSLPDYGDIMKLKPEVLIADVLNNIDIEEIFGLKIAKLN